MPQIAQRDYKIIKPTLGRAVTVDAAALAELKKAFLNGIIYDCIINSPIVGDSGDGRVLGTVSPNPIIFVSDPDDGGGTATINFPYTVTQYQGLAAVQVEIDRIGGEVINYLPTLRNTGTGLIESNSGSYIGTPEGFPYEITIVDGKLATIEASTIKTEDEVFAISIEDAQKLIGLPCEGY